MKAKKVYIIPAVNTVKIRPAVTMLAASDRKINDEVSATGYGDGPSGGINGDGNGDTYARESLNAWDEW